MKDRLGTEGVLSRLVAAASVFLVAALPAGAQRTTFNPSISIGSSYTDNVGYLDEPGGNTEDTVTTARLVLPLVHQQDRGAMRLTYRTGWFLYGDESQNDSNEQSLTFGLNRKTRRRSTWTVTSRYLKTEEQQTSPILPTEITPGPSEGLDDVSLSLTERTDRQTIDATVGYGWTAGRKWGFNATFTAGESEFDGGADVEDRAWYGPSFSAQNTISRRTSLGVRYSFRRTELDLTGDEDFHTTDLFWNYDLSRKVGLGLHLGGFVRNPENSESETGTFGGVDVRFNDGLTLGPVRLGFTASATPSGGGALVGTALASTAAVTVSGVRTYPVNWQVGTFYNHRSPFDSSEPTTETYGLRAGVEPAISRIVGLRIGASYSEQTSDDPTQEGSFTRAGVNLVIYPLGGTRIAGR
jgi:hypothetical protein